MDSPYDKSEIDTRNKIMQAILEKCDFYYDDALLSKETIIMEYLKFLAKQFNPNEKTIGFAFHTGSKCFDMVALPALLIGSLFYGFSSIDDILGNLEIGDMVIYKNRKYKSKRYRFKGFSTKKMNNIEYECIDLEEDNKEKPKLSLIYEQNKHLITPCHGGSEKTGGQGLKKSNEFRADFISYILDIPIEDVPTELDYSVVVVAHKDYIINLCKHIKIKYQDKMVKLTDIVPISYYTSSDRLSKIASNPSTAEAVIKVASTISTAREIVFDKSGNEVIGLMLLNAMPKKDNYSELDILNKKMIKFAIINEPLNFKLCNWAMDNYKSAKFFACTRDYLEQFENDIYANNEFTKDLNNKVVNIICHDIDVPKLNNGISYDDDKFKKKLKKIEFDDSFDNRDDFCKLAWGLRTLFNKSFIKMSELEKLVSNDVLNIESPKAKLDILSDIAFETEYTQKQADKIGLTLVTIYYSLFNNSPKETELTNLLLKHSHDKVAFIVPKKYLVNIFESVFANKFTNVECMYPGKFKRKYNWYKEYDIIILSGYISDFDVFDCFSAPDIIVLCYDFEKKSFLNKEMEIKKIERKLDEKIQSQMRESE